MKQRVSSGGKYVSVNIGPVRVVSREQVIFLLSICIRIDLIEVIILTRFVFCHVVHAMFYL